MEICCIGITMVDNNDPLEENITDVGAPVTEGGIYDGKVWVDDGIDPRISANHHRCGPKLPSVSPSIATNLKRLYSFLILFPMLYVKGTILQGIKWRLPEGYPHMSEHEFMK